MTTIGKEKKFITLINVFTVDPAKQHELVDLLARATESSVCDVPGFISASLHRGLDGIKVAMYAQWRSIEDYQAMRQNGVTLPYMQQAVAVAKFEPGMYEVVETFEPDLALQLTRLRRAALKKCKESIMNDETNPVALRPPEAGG